MARPGTPSKGDRTAITMRVPTKHRHVFEARAHELGLPLSDYCALLLAQAHELDEPAYLHRNRGQKELPLGA